MLKHLVRLMLAVSWAVASMLAAQDVESRSSFVPLENLALIQVQEWNKTQPVAQMRADLHQFAAREGLLVGQVVASVSDNRGARTIHLAGHGAEQMIQQQPTVDFGTSVRTSFADMTEIEAHSPVGGWVVYGGEDDVRSVAAELERLGAEVFVEWPSGFPQFELSSRVSWAVALVVATACAALTVSRTRRHAIYRLHGGSAIRASYLELRWLTASWGIAGAVTLLGGTVWVSMRYAGVGLKELALQALSYGLMYAVAAILGSLASLAGVYATDLNAALKGEIPAKGIMALSFGLRAVSMVLALTALSGAFSVGLSSEHRREALEATSALGDASMIILGGAHDNDAQDRMGLVVGSWLRSQDVQGRILVAGEDRFREHEALIVNQRYLDFQEVRLADGKDARSSIDMAKVSVLLPQGYFAGDSESLMPEMREWFELYCDCVDPPMSSRLYSDGVELRMFGLPSEIAGRETGQRERTFIRDPIVFVAPPRLFNSYVSLASLGRVFVLDSDAVMQQITRDTELSRFVVSVTPIQTRAAHYAAQAEQDLRESVFTAGMASLVAVLAGLSLGIAHGKLNASRIFVRHIHGLPAWLSYRLLLVFEVLLGVVLLAWVPMTLARLRGQYDAMAALGGGLEPPPTLQAIDLAPALAILLVVTGLFVVTLALAHHRVVKHGMSEA